MESKDQIAEAKMAESSTAAESDASALVESDGSVKEKSFLVVRMKPIGKGETQLSQDYKNTFASKEYAGCSYENHSVSFKSAHKGNIIDYNFPDMVATDDFTNKRMYEETVAKKVPLILDGFSMVIWAYGQTGSGKTHTMIGKLGVFKNSPSDDLDNLDDNLGIFPRAALEILQGLKAKPEPTAMTITICESLGMHPMDLVTGTPIWMDPTTNELMGGKEHLIETYDDVFKLGAIFESQRTCGATKFNDTSSRSHAMIWVRIYTKTADDKLRINTLKIVDLAGSERVQNLKQGDPRLEESMWINCTLTFMSQIVEQLNELKKPVEGGKEIPRNIRWKQFFLTRAIKEAFNGLAFTQFIFCAKQYDHNSGETYSTLIYAERFKKFQGRVSKPKSVSLKKQIAFYEQRINTNSKKLEQMQAAGRKQKANDQFDRVKLNQSFVAADKFSLDLLKKLAGGE